MFHYLRIFSDSLRRRGFTLVELVVVIVILLILLAVTIPTLTKYIGDAQQTQTDINAHYNQLMNEITKLETIAPATPSSIVVPTQTP